MPNSIRSSSSSTSSEDSSSSTIGTPPTPSRSGFLFRAVGVALFLGLGTFAVMQTMWKQPHRDSDRKHGHLVQGESELKSELKLDTPPVEQAVRTAPVVSKGFNVAQPQVRNDFKISDSPSTPKTSPVKFPEPKAFEVKPAPRNDFALSKPKPPTIPPVVPKSDFAAAATRRTTPVLSLIHI